MENSAYIFDLLKIVLPALLVLLAAWLVLRKFTGKSQKAFEHTLPLRLQAYERLILLVERITPSNLLVRSHRPGLTAKELNSILIAEVRSEFEHNLAQQLYVSERGWKMVRSLKDETVAMINGITQKLPEEADGMELTRTALKYMTEGDHNPYEQTLAFLKEEVKAFF